MILVLVLEYFLSLTLLFQCLLFLIRNFCILHLLSGLSPYSTGQSSTKEVSNTPKEEPSTLFQRQRVDMLLAELVRQFPLPITQTANQVS